MDGRTGLRGIIMRSPLILILLFSSIPVLGQTQATIYAVTTDTLLEIDSESGKVIHEIAVGTLGGHVSIVSDGTRVFIISGAETVLVVDPNTGETQTINTYCCLTGSSAVVGTQLYVLSEELSKLTLTSYDKTSGQGLNVIGIPPDVVALTVVQASPVMQPTSTPAPPMTPSPLAATPTATATASRAPDPAESGGGACNIHETLTDGGMPFPLFLSVAALLWGRHSRGSRVDSPHRPTNHPTPGR